VPILFLNKSQKHYSRSMESRRARLGRSHSHDISYSFLQLNCPAYASLSCSLHVPGV